MAIKPFKKFYPGQIVRINAPPNVVFTDPRLQGALGKVLEYNAEKSLMPYLIEVHDKPWWIAENALFATTDKDKKTAWEACDWRPHWDSRRLVDEVKIMLANNGGKI